MISWTSLKMGHVGSKTRSLGQMLENTYVCFRGHIFSQIKMKDDQHLCFDEISHEFENGSCWVKNQVTRSNLRKTFFTLFRPYFQSDNHETWSELFH